MQNVIRSLKIVLLIVLGAFISVATLYYLQQYRLDDHAKVKVTEIKHSNKPLFSDKQLAKMDDRFLFKQVAQNVRPAVVYVESVVKPSKEDLPDNFHDHKDNNSFWNKIMPRRAKTVGSGIVISPDGYILTNNHVVEGAVDGGIEVDLHDKETFKARVVGHDATTDLAVLKIDARNLPVLTMGNSDKMEVGDWVLAVGNPFRLRSTVTAGIVSAKSRDMKIIRNRMRVENFIQTDAAINKGNSGGALVNTSGELIGVNTAIASETGDYQGYGFAIPSNLAQKVAKDLIEFGKVHRALLGISILSMNARIAKEMNMRGIRGVFVRQTMPGGAADKAGLKPNDVIIKVDSQSVDEANKLQQEIAVHHPGDVVNLEIWRDGKTFDRRVKLKRLNQKQMAVQSDTVERPRERPSPPSPIPHFRGIQLSKFDFGMQVMQIKAGKDSTAMQLFVTKVVKDSPADRAGLQHGMKIMSIGGKQIKGLESLEKYIHVEIHNNQALDMMVELPDGRPMKIHVEEE